MAELICRIDDFACTGDRRSPSIWARPTNPIGSLYSRVLNSPQRMDCRAGGGCGRPRLQRSANRILRFELIPTFVWLCGPISAPPMSWGRDQCRCVEGIQGSAAHPGAIADLDEFDLHHRRQDGCDHRLTVPGSLDLRGPDRSSLCKVVPLAVNVIQYRHNGTTLLHVGKAIRRAIASCPGAARHGVADGHRRRSGQRPG